MKVLLSFFSLFSSIFDELRFFGGKSILTSFWVGAVPESWSKPTIAKSKHVTLYNGELLNIKALYIEDQVCWYFLQKCSYLILMVPEFQTSDRACASPSQQTFLQRTFSFLFLLIFFVEFFLFTIFSSVIFYFSS